MPAHVLTPGDPAEPVTPDTGEESEAMALIDGVIDQNAGRLLSAGASAHEHFVQFGKILDLAYEADRKMVSLVQALGVRESASQSGHQGIPLAGKTG